MRKWGLVVTACYFAILMGIVLPAVALSSGWNVRGVYSTWQIWVLAIPFVAGEALLLFLSVDTSRQKLKPRTSIVVSAVHSGFFFALLTGSIVFCVLAAVYGDKLPDEVVLRLLAVPIALWVIWGIFFAVYLRKEPGRMTRITAWLLKGSVLELLVAVPSHVIVRRRDDCCAPLATGFGIASGIAIMLMSFGPGILLLYKKYIDEHGSKRGERMAHA